jgi:hypothetical protein
VSRPPFKLDSPRTHGPGEAQTEGQTRWATDTLISIRDIRELFGLGRTAVYNSPIVLIPGTHQALVRCYRWWASEVIAFAADVRLRTTIKSKPRRWRGAHRPSPNDPAPLRITGRCASPQPEGI